MAGGGIYERRNGGNRRPRYAQGGIEKDCYLGLFKLLSLFCFFFLYLETLTFSDFQCKTAVSNWNSWPTKFSAG